MGSIKQGPWFGIDEFDIPNGNGISFTSPHVFLQPGRDEGKYSLDANIIVTMDTVTIKIVDNCVRFVFSFIVCISID